MFIEALQLLFLFMYCTGPHTKTKSTFSLSLKGIIIVSNVTVESIKDTSCMQTKLCLFRGYQTVVDGSCVCKRAHYAKMRYQITFNALFLQKTPIRKTRKNNYIAWLIENQQIKLEKILLKHFKWFFQKPKRWDVFFFTVVNYDFYNLNNIYLKKNNYQCFDYRVYVNDWQKQRQNKYSTYIWYLK